MHAFRTKILTVLTVAGFALGTSFGLAGTAHAASPQCAAALNGCQSFNVPLKGGFDLDALNWGINPQTGTSYNDEVAVWSQASAGRAADFVQVPVNSTVVSSGPAVPSAASTHPFFIEFAPKGVLSGYCVSTITDAQGAYARLRLCAANASSSSFNPWQSFVEIPQGDGFFQFEAYGENVPYVLNDRAWGGNGSPVISYPGQGAAENQIWETNG